MRGRRSGESLFHWDIVPGLWFQLVIHDVKLTNSQNLPPRPKNRFNPDYSRGVGVDMEKTRFIEMLIRVCGFESSPTT